MDTKTALVSGGTSGIGRACCEVLSQSGWRVVPADIKPGPDGLALDVRDASAWQEAFESAGPLDALVNCAGVRTRVGLVDMTLPQWEAVLATNLTGTFLGTQAFFRHLRDSGRPGAVVNIASVNAQSAVPGQVHYVASKAGVVAFTKAAAIEGAPDGIRVNAVAPGAIRTPMLEQRLSEPGQQEWLESRIPLHRIGAPQDPARAVAFLLSEAASYITGVTLPVDGGWLAS